MFMPCTAVVEQQKARRALKDRWAIGRHEIPFSLAEIQQRTITSHNLSRRSCSSRWCIGLKQGWTGFQVSSCQINWVNNHYL